VAVTIAFLGVGWAGTLFGLLRVYTLLRRERGSGGTGGLGAMDAVSGRRHELLHQASDDVEL
jgi:hypothetical protein